MEVQKIDEMLERVSQGIAIGSRSYGFNIAIGAMLKIIREACQEVKPVYWEGVARTWVLAGDFYKESDKAYSYYAYDRAIDTLSKFPFSADTLSDQEKLIEYVLWERFALARQLGMHEEAVAAAVEAITGIDHATGYIDPKLEVMCWDRVEPVRVRGWRRLYMRQFIARSLRKEQRRLWRDARHAKPSD